MRIKLMLPRLHKDSGGPSHSSPASQAVVSSMIDLEQSQHGLREALEASYPFTGGLRRRQHPRKKGKNGKSLELSK